MSIDTLFTLILGLVGAAITILIAKSNTEKGKAGRKQRFLYNKLLYILFLLAIVFVSIYIIGDRNKKQAAYEAKMDEAYFEFNNFNFINAAELYYDASQISYNTATYLDSKFRIATCYYLYAVMNDLPEYYQNAAAIYKSIINTKEYRNHVRYIDSLCVLADIHIMTEDQWDNSSLKDIIRELESTLTREPYNKYYSEELSLKLNVLNTLALYYDYAMKSDYLNTVNPWMLQKVLDYSSNFSEVYKQTIESKYSVSVFDFETYNIERLTDSMLNYSMFSENPVEYCEDIIYICEAEIERIGVSKLPISNLVKLKRNISLAHIYISLYDAENKMEELQQAYNELKDFIGVEYCTENQNIRKEIISSYYCLILTEMCSEEDLKEIIRLFEEELCQKEFLDDLSLRAGMLISVTEAYKTIAEKYSDSIIVQEVFDLAKTHLNEANNLRTFMDEYDLDRLADAQQFFSNNILPNDE